MNDTRWAGTYGVEADFIAKTHCSVEYISTTQVNVIIMIFAQFLLI